MGYQPIVKKPKEVYTMFAGGEPIAVLRDPVISDEAYVEVPDLAPYPYRSGRAELVKRREELREELRLVDGSLGLVRRKGMWAALKRAAARVLRVFKRTRTGVDYSREPSRQVVTVLTQAPGDDFWQSPQRGDTTAISVEGTIIRAEGSVNIRQPEPRRSET